ncbi:MAG: flagellar M-ring protein FliF [Oscillospiraceae bacterium]|nr:flagellar M-ring protein FliF [Oscillospiraceae bacterium]
MAMKDQAEKLVKSFTQFWEAQDKKRRFAYVAIIICIILAAVIITAILNKKDYVVLYEGLETQEASEMVSLIEGMGYEARLSNGNIAVLKGTENTIAIQLAQQEYPKSGKNYNKVTTNSGMFKTEREQKLNERIDIQDRLGAIISSMECIRSADVTLTDPELQDVVVPSLRQPPTAAVYVNLDGVERLTNKQIIGITHIVKLSWPGLTDENIMIVDGNGIPQIANALDDYDLVLEETRRLAFKTNLENTIKNKILDLMVPIYGEDGVSVAVNMVLDFDPKVTETVDYRPEDNTNTGVLQHADASNASGGATVDGGIVGLEGNADDTYPTGDTNGNGLWNEESVSNTYLVDTYKEQVEKAGYDIEGLSISVVVYRDYLSEPEKLDLVRLVGNAGTVNPEVLEDVVTVTNFSRWDAIGPELDIEPKFLFGLTFNQLILVGAIVLILILVILIIMAVLSSNAKKKRKAFEKQIIETSGLVTDGGEPVDTFTFSEAGEPVEVPSLTDDQIETKEVVIRREISDFAKYSPEIVAQLLKNWMKEEDD